ncbi:tetratricopeptide repeat protein [Rudaea cellulosilytica]|uniref:tetratricopeptide repeat protein n=1 Tax=Rudaea cellulosilytica TaxID=540746 RepID=UPI000380C89F|nr:tetratricopeptide repeat protein [Rudaea cellulosilytica]
MSGKLSFFAELKRRNVIRAAVLYIGAVWALAQGIAQLSPAIGLPDMAARWFLIATTIGFPFWLVFSWLYEWTSQGLKRESEVAADTSITRSTGRKMDRAIIAVLAIAVVLLLTNTFLWRKGGLGGDAASSTSGKSIAVLPFDDLSPGHDHGYFSAGLAEELLNALAKVQELKVAGRASSFYYASHNAELRTIGQALSVANVLQGAVRTQGDAVRISVHLVRTGDGFEVWSQSYDGDLHDIFDVQERIARAITERLKIVLSGSEQSRLVPVATTSADAYADFVTAQTLVNKRVDNSLPQAIALLQKATALDPKFARAWSKLAVAYAVLPQYTAAEWGESWRNSDAAAQRALALDPDDAEAYAALSYNQFSQRHFEAMVEPMHRALQQAPDNSAVNYWAANELAAMGRTRDAEARIDAALVNDPANNLLLFYKSMTRWRIGDEAGALDYIRRAGVADSPFGALMLQYYDAAHADVQGAARDFVKAIGKMGTRIAEGDLHTIYFGTFGDETQRQTALKIIDAHAEDNWAPTLLLQLGEPARSFDLYEQGHSGLSDAYFNWLWQPEEWSRKALRDPSFQGFARRIGMVAYWQHYGWPDLCHPVAASDPQAFTCQ